MDVSSIAAMHNALAGADATSTSAAQPVQAVYGANLSSDEQAFQNSMDAAAIDPAGSESVSEVAKAVFEPLNHINNEAAELAEFAQAALESENTLSPSEMVALTVRSQEFMFHSQLTANIANRTADGVQQLFRQQG